MVDIFDLNQKTETLTAGNKERLEVLQDLDYWHAHFQAIMASDFDEDEDDCLKDGEWDEMLDTKHSARSGFSPLLCSLDVLSSCFWLFFWLWLLLSSGAESSGKDGVGAVQDQDSCDV